MLSHITQIIVSNIIFSFSLLGFHPVDVGIWAVLLSNQMADTASADRVHVYIQSYGISVLSWESTMAIYHTE